MVKSGRGIDPTVHLYRGRRDDFTNEVAQTCIEYYLKQFFNKGHLTDMAQVENATLIGVASRA